MAISPNSSVTTVPRTFPSAASAFRARCVAERGGTTKVEAFAPIEAAAVALLALPSGRVGRASWLHGRRGHRRPRASQAPSTGEVRAIVERRRGLDTWAEARLVVQAAPGVLAHRMETPTESGTEIPMTVELATRELRPGGILAGTVTANPTVEGWIRGLRVQLVRERHEQDGIVERYVEAETVVTLTGEADVRPGVSIFSPFQIAAPADPVPCWDARYNSEHWYLEVVADVPMMRDEVTRIELLVTQRRQVQDDGVNGTRPEPYPA
jgi:hypothetical protein